MSVGWISISADGLNQGDMSTGEFVKRGPVGIARLPAGVINSGYSNHMNYYYQEYVGIADQSRPYYMMSYRCGNSRGIRAGRRRQAARFEYRTLGPPPLPPSNRAGRRD